MQTVSEPVRPTGLSAEGDTGERSGVCPVQGLVREHLPHVYRLLRHLGVPTSDVDDAIQQVFWVLSRKLARVSPGSERAFLSSTAVRIASRWRRTHRRRKETGQDESLSQRPAPGPSPERQLQRAEAERLLLQVLEVLPEGLREIFVLFEIEELTLRQIAVTLGLPQGTVASRLRSARQRFQAAAAELASPVSERSTE